MKSAKLKVNPDSPEYQAALREIVQGAFVREGLMVAFPLGFPDVTLPIPPDESRITALDRADGGAVIYGGTSGRKTHLFTAMFHGATGMVYDLGVVEGAERCPALCCLAREFVACVNGPRGGRLIRRDLEPVPFDLIQEWYFERKPFEDLGEPAPGEPILHAVADSAGTGILGVTSRHLFRWTTDTRRIDRLEQLERPGRLFRMPNGDVFGPDSDRSLWRWDSKRRRLERRAIPLPRGKWDSAPWNWAAAPDRGPVYVADASGRIFSFETSSGFSGPIARTPLASVGPMAVTGDGRLFGFCGEGIARLFCLDPVRRRMDDLGCAVSVIQRRRYGYQFGDAVTGRDGELLFGEDDEFGHLWLYFPKIVNPSGVMKRKQRL